MIVSLPASAFRIDITETTSALTSSVGEPVVPVNTTHTEPAAPPSVIPTEAAATSTSPAETKIYARYKKSKIKKVDTYYLRTHTMEEKLGSALNPNRAEMPGSKRKGSYDHVSGQQLGRVIGYLGGTTLFFNND